MSGEPGTGFEQHGSPDFVEWRRGDWKLWSQAVDTRAVREWAATQGIPLSTRGRIPRDLGNAYLEARLAPSTNPVPRPRVDGPLLPQARVTQVVRTSFTDDHAWRALGEAVRAPTVEGFLARVELVDDDAFRGLTPTELLDRIPDGYEHRLLFVADETSMAGPDHALLAIDLDVEPGLAFRAAPARVQAIDDNITTGNMWFRSLAY